MRLHTLQALSGKRPGIKPLRLRTALPRDLRALLALEHLCFTGDRMSERSFRAHLASPRATFLLAEGDAGLLAAALVLRRADSRAARLYSIAVHPAARGRGLGHRLLRRLEHISARQGVSEMRLEVSARNRIALALYEESGYEIVGRWPRYYEDGSDALRLRKRLRRAD